MTLPCLVTGRLCSRSMALARKALPAMLLVMGGLPLSAHAVGIQAFSVGRLDAHTSTNRALPVAATGDVCGYAEAGAKIAGAPDAVIAPSSAPAPVACSISFVKPPASTLGVLGGQGVLLKPKFPAPVGTGATSSVNVMIATPTTTTSKAVAFWSSTEDVNLGGSTHSATLLARADVDNAGATPPGGTAASESKDPWFFTPDVDMQLMLDITLSEVELKAIADADGYAFAAIEALGGFGEGTVAGQNALETWSFWRSVENNESFSLDHLVLLHGSLTLTAGTTYWLTADLRTVGELNGVPEPSTPWLVGIAAVWLALGRDAYRRDKSHGDRRRCRH